MTDNEIIKALECCFKYNEGCDKCPIEDECLLHQPQPILLNHTLDLINRKCSEIEALTARTAKQEATIDRLENEKALLQGEVADAQTEIERLQADNKTLENVIKNTFLEKAGLDIDPLAEVKAKAIKEFAERLCADRVSNDPVVIAVKAELKEMLGDT